MKKVYSNKIINIENTDLFDNKFLFDYFENISFDKEVEVFYVSELLKKKENTELLSNLGDKYAMYSNVYSSKDEFDIFEGLFNYAIKNNKKIHIVGVTLKEEIELLEKYYTELGFMREDINCFTPDFSKALVTVSVNIENLIWKGSDYKRMRKEIFFIPPIRESGENKAMFKGINRGVIAGVNISSFTSEVEDFLSECLVGEKILSMTMAKILFSNLEQVGVKGNIKELIVEY